MTPFYKDRLRAHHGGVRVHLAMVVRWSTSDRSHGMYRNTSNFCVDLSYLLLLMVQKSGDHHLGFF